MRERFFIDPDRTRPRSEPYAGARKAVLVIALALTGVAAIHSLYPQDNAAADPTRGTDLTTPAPTTLTQVLPAATANPTPAVPSTNSLHALTVAAEQTTSGAGALESGTAGQLQVSETQGRTAEQPSAKVEASPAPKQKTVRHRSNREVNPYAQYGYRDNRSWAWYSQRPTASPFFHF